MCSPLSHVLTGPGGHLLITLASSRSLSRDFRRPIRTCTVAMPLIRLASAFYNNIELGFSGKRCWNCRKPLKELEEEDRTKGYQPSSHVLTPKLSHVLTPN